MVGRGFFNFKIDLSDQPGGVDGSVPYARQLYSVVFADIKMYC